DLSSTAATTTLDAHDNVVAPGFIDLLGQSQYSVLRDPHVEAKVRQGVTTEVTGEGHSPGPVSPAVKDSEAPPNEPQRWTTLGEYFGVLEKNGSAINFAFFVGASNPREMVIGDEGDHIDMGLDEAFRIGREAKIPVNVWHLKVGGAANWGKMPHVVERIAAARAEGLDVAANVYPYIASSTSLSTLIPDWAMEGGYKEMQKRLQDPAQRPKIIEALRAQVAKRRERGIYVARVGKPELGQYDKKFIEEIAAMMQTTPEEALVRLFLETTGSPSVI